VTLAGGNPLSLISSASARSPPDPLLFTSHVSDYDALFERVVIPAPLEAGDRAAGSASRDNAFSRRHGLRGWQDASARADAPAEFS
jgi:hypothetical protein